MMKSKILVFFIILFCNEIFAQKTIYSKAKVQSVNVYRNSAELNNIAEFSIPKGTSEVVIGNVSERINKKSIQISMNSSKITILSTQFTNNYAYKFDIKNNNSPELKKINDSIKVLEKQITREKITYEANKKTIELLDKNQLVLIGSNSSNVAQLSQLVQFYKQKRIELSNTGTKINVKINLLNKKLKSLRQRMISHQAGDEEKFARGVLVLKVSSTLDINVKLGIRYLAYGTTWNPFYEIKGNSIKEPLHVNFKAIIKQNTGVDWKNVKLALINGTSSRNSTAPTLYPWFLNAYDNSVNTQNNRVKKSRKFQVQKKMMSNIVMDEVEETEEVYTEESVGFQIQANQLNISYNVDMPYTILSDSEENIVNLYNQKIKADYNYFTAPNSNRSAFLIAKVNDFSKYGLVSAKANIIFENMYIGETYINPDTTNDELVITLGDDPRITIKREDIKEKSGRKFLSGNQEKTIVYDLIVRNNKKEAIAIEVKDRFPISNNKSVEVELLKINGAKKEVEKGFLTWDLKIRPRETKKIRVSYKITYPKNYTISNL